VLDRGRKERWKNEGRCLLGEPIAARVNTEHSRNGNRAKARCHCRIPTLFLEVLLLHIAVTPVISKSDPPHVLWPLQPFARRLRRHPFHTTPLYAF
jgi:hypothetical protein